MRSWLQQSLRSLRSVTVPALAGLVVFGLAACGGDGPTEPDVDQQQAEEVAAAVSAAMGATFSITAGGSSAASVAPGALTPGSVRQIPLAAETTSYSFDNSTSCPEGGSVRANGDGTVRTSGTSTSSTVEWEWNSQASYSSCTVQADENANLFVLSTASPINFTGTGSITSKQSGDGGGTFTWNYSGTFDWDEQGGPSGSCDVDLTTNLDIQSLNNTVEWTGSIRGTVCGQDIDRTFDTVVSV